MRSVQEEFNEWSSSTRANECAVAAERLNNKPLRETSISNVFHYVALVLIVSLIRGVAAPPLLDDFNPGLNGELQTAISIPDGRVLVAGNFLVLGESTQRGLVLLQTNGLLDFTFSGPPGGSVITLAPLQDGTVLAGGIFQFPSEDGAIHRNLVRLKPDGSVDAAFKASPDDMVVAIHVMEDGRILIGGKFGYVNGVFRKCLARLNSDGTLDPTFTPSSANGYIHSLDTLSDGSVLAAGLFSMNDAPGIKYVAKFDSKGTLDLSFHPRADMAVTSMAVRPDGALYIGGIFSSINDIQQTSLARLLPTGEMDETFRPLLVGPTYSLGPLMDGRILAAGDLVSGNGSSSGRLVMISNTGSLDLSFVSPFDQEVTSIAQQPDGAILACGPFRFFGTKLRSGLARLDLPNFADSHLEMIDGKLNWRFSGDAPFVTHVRFEVSEDGSTWKPLGRAQLAGDPVRFESPHWTLPINPLRTNSIVRAWGNYSCGVDNGSQSLVSKIGGPPILVQPPSSTNVIPGHEVVLTATFSGLGPLSYQWYKDGVLVVDDLHLSGASTPALRISNAQLTDEGDYRVKAFNPVGVGQSLPSTLTLLDPLILTNPVGGLLNLGETLEMSVVAQGGTPITYRWLHDGILIPDVETPVYTLHATGVFDAGAYQAVVVNAHASVTSSVAQVRINAVNVDKRFRPSFPELVSSFAVDHTKRVIVSLGLNPFSEFPTSPSLRRLTEDGSIDPRWGFPIDGILSTLAVLHDDSLLVGGTFRNLDNQPRQRFARVLPNGQIDTNFHPNPDGVVAVIVPLSDNSVIVGGSFNSIGGVVRRGIAKISVGGVVDETFNVNSDGPVINVAVQPDGQMIIWGRFLNLAHMPHPNLARIKPDGSLDQTFSIAVVGSISSIAIQPDGKILLGGSFVSLGGTPRSYLARLNPDGSIDETFVSQVIGNVSSILIRANGKIVIGGSFQSIGVEKHAFLAQLNPDGTPDSNFQLDPDGPLSGLGLLPDGKLLVSGTFSNIGGEPFSGIAAILSAERVPSSFTKQDSTLRWSLSGVAAAASAPQFSFSTNGAPWIDFGSPHLITNPDNSGGMTWEVSSAEVPNGASIRARSLSKGGNITASAWWTDIYAGIPFVAAASSDSEVTHPAGETHFLNVTAFGSEPLTYTYYKDGQPLPAIPGEGSVRSLPDLRKADEGVYSVVVANSEGQVTNVLTRIHVIDPYLQSDPSSISVDLGTSAKLNVQAVGTDLHYSWFHNGEKLALANASTLTLDPASEDNIGEYFAVVTNAFGSVTSKVATLRVNLSPRDLNFRPPINGVVNAVTIQPNGNLLIGGSRSLYTESGSVLGPLCRLTPHGSLANNTSSRVIVEGDVNTLIQQIDGGLLIGGPFFSVEERPWFRFAKLKQSGRLDEDFKSSLGNNPQDNVYACLNLPDGSVLVGGFFTFIGEQPHSCITRMSPSGEVDTNFVCSIQPTFPIGVRCLALQTDGKILVGGGFAFVNGDLQPNLARLNADGSLDKSFHPQIQGVIQVLVVQRDGTILAGGSFPSVNNVARASLVRLLSENGALDPSFDPALASTSLPSVTSIAYQCDGSIVVGGSFSQCQGFPRTNIARFLPSGMLDQNFFPKVPTAVSSFAIDAQGSIYVAEIITPQFFLPLQKFSASSTPQEEFHQEIDGMRWTRTGPSPDFWRASVELNLGPGNWSAPFPCAAVSNGWFFAWPPNVTQTATQARWRGYVNGGNPSSSGWFIERIVPVTPATLPRILLDDGGIGVVNHRIGFNISGAVGQTIIVERSFSLLDWIPVWTNTLTETSIPFAEESPSSHGTGFYRLRLGP